MLILSILLYPLLTYLATPAVQVRHDGHWTLVCTLKGLKAVYVDLETYGGLQVDADDHCPALDLLELVGTAFRPAPQRYPDEIAYALAVLDQSDRRGYLSSHHFVFSSRAPPRA